jgi:hypothetical protein
VGMSQMRKSAGGTMAKGELVLELSLEGAGVTIYRTPVATGGWQFHIGGSTIDLDENDSEVWRSWQTELFTSLDEALRSVTKDGSWVIFFPTNVHPEYRAVLWPLAQDAADNLTDAQKKHWNRRIHEWRRECQEDS